MVSKHLFWLFMCFAIASCTQDFDVKQAADDFMAELTNDSAKETGHSHHDHSAMDHSKMDHSKMDHSHMDHSKMDHSAHDSHGEAGQDHSAHAGHAGHDHGASASSGHDHGASASGGGHDHGGHMMKMWFHGGCNEVILFDFWRIDSCLGLIISCVIIFVMGALYEGLKWFRLFLQISQNRKTPVSLPVAVTSHSGCQKNNNGANEPLVVSRSVTPAKVKNAAFSLPRMIQASLYIVQLVLAYWLMLIVMTYNTWLSLAVVFGAGFGHWIFAVLRLENPNGEAADSFATDACH